MVTWKLTEVQLKKIKDYTDRNNAQNPHVKIIPNIADGVLLGLSVRFSAPKSWLTVTPENAKLEELIYDEIEKCSRWRLFPVRDGLFRRGVLELKFSSVHRASDEKNVVVALEFIADDLIDVMIGKKEL